MPRRERDDDIYEFFDEETLKRADELVSSLSSTLGLERRGQTTYYQGAVADMNQSGSRFIKVTVADSGNNGEQLVLVSEQPLSVSNKALLVYRAGPGHDLKYMGLTSESRPGRRQEDEGENRFFTIYTINQDVRRQR
ncbi:hypothetical protein G4Y73_04180 [Wenzhouxiangella sp. XN201]|uniref:hypothetical protein n=1 Tax=Wenzhouxiangella sp. XN201 TaxID=2710755 RepID=UPI0013C54A4A|nr:hypothetical protein [Wenzhouxiangella sp. XN201]NEZ03344.1 hypothetical protein [Wenzhouxiangella sp. XN201]